MDAERLPSLSTLRVFEAAARTGSFRAAASALHLTPSAVSHSVRSLEFELGRELFVRRSRRLELTEAGKTLHGYVARAFVELRRGRAAVRQNRPTNILSVASVPTFAATFLTRRIEDFERRHSGIQLRLELTHALSDFEVEPADVAIWLGEKLPSGLFSEILFPLVSAPVCAPQIARRIKTPADLAGVTRISIAQYPEGWDVWFRAASAGKVQASREVKFDVPATALLAALDGTGVVMAPLAIVAHHLEAGRLVMPFPDVFKSRLSYRLVCRKGEENLAKIGRFRQWLRAEIKNVRPAYGGQGWDGGADSPNVCLQKTAGRSRTIPK